MTMLLLTLALISGLALALLTRTIRHDGYGSRPGPRSHHDPFPTHLSR